MATVDSKGPTPPYVAWGTFLNLLDRMAKEGVPSRIDKTYLGSTSGATQSQLRVALKSFGLVDDEYRTNEHLVPLAENVEQRPQAIATLLRGTFPDLVDLCEKGNSTQGELLEALRNYGLVGDSVRKASTFFIAAAKFAGLPLSPHFGPVRTSSGGGPRKPRRKSKAQGTPQEGGNGSSEASSVDAMKQQYFDLLIDKARTGEADDGSLLDRIERLIGLGSPEPRKTARKSGTDAGSTPATQPAP